MALLRLAILGATLLTGALAACAPEQTGPASDGGLLHNTDPPARGTGTGTGTDALLGTWQVMTVIPIGADFQTSTVIWQFDANGTCRQDVTTLLASEGIPRLTRRDCTWSSGLNAITVTFTGSLPATFSVAFAAFSADRLVLDGLEYSRVP
jgi:hypothetical protein